MKKLLILSTALTGMAFAASAQELTVMSWGGAYGAAQTEAHVKPFTAATGIAAVMTDSDNPATPIKAMVEAGNVTLDVASVEYADAIRLCDEGMLEPIDINALPAGADGTPAADDFLPGAVTDDYTAYPYYSETTAPPRRIVAACLSAERPFPQLARWSAQVTIHVITPGEYATGHDEVVTLVQESLRDIVAQDFTSANVTVAGMLETGHTVDRSDNRITDVLAVTLYCQQN
jgi:hypothetical protein